MEIEKLFQLDEWGLGSLHRLDLVNLVSGAFFIHCCMKLKIKAMYCSCYAVARQMFAVLAQE
jgi:hypothetical protein